MDIYTNLFSASIALAGFTAVFLVFRYQTIDTYVDNRKPLLRSLLETQIHRDPYIAVRIQDIGKNPKVDDAKFFSQFNNPAVNKFVSDILDLRKRRNYTRNFGLACISFWGVLSLFYLVQYRIYCPATIISIVLFGLSVILTLWFIFFSLFIKRSE